MPFHYASPSSPKTQILEDTSVRNEKIIIPNAQCLKFLGLSRKEKSPTTGIFNYDPGGSNMGPAGFEPAIKRT